MYLIKRLSQENTCDLQVRLAVLCQFRTVERALQIAKNEPTGPMYLWARREVMEKVSPECMQNLSGIMSKWPTVKPTALLQSAAKHIALQKSLVITFSYRTQTPVYPALSRSRYF